MKVGTIEPTVLLLFFLFLLPNLLPISLTFSFSLLNPSLLFPDTPFFLPPHSEMGSYYVATAGHEQDIVTQAGFELMLFLPQPTERIIHMEKLTCLALPSLK